MPVTQRKTSAKPANRKSTQPVAAKAGTAKKPSTSTPVSTTATSQPVLAKLFLNGRSQAVRLPKEFRLEGKEVQVSRVGNGVLLEPIQAKSREQQWDEFFASLAQYRDLDPMPGGRNQGVLEPEDIFPEGW